MDRTHTHLYLKGENSVAMRSDEVIFLPKVCFGVVGFLGGFKQIHYGDDGGRDNGSRDDVNGVVDGGDGDCDGEGEMW